MRGIAAGLRGIAAGLRTFVQRLACSRRDFLRQADGVVGNARVFSLWSGWPAQAVQPGAQKASAVPAAGAVPYRVPQEEGFLLDRPNPAVRSATLQARRHPCVEDTPYAHRQIDIAASLGASFDRGARALATVRVDCDVQAHFQASLLTEDSGMRIFSKTFVQRASRESLRHRPLATPLVCYMPQQREPDRNGLLRGARAVDLDPAESLVGASQTAGCTRRNLQRLPAAPPPCLPAWQADTSTADVVGPGLPRGIRFTLPITMPRGLRLLA